jgi:catechol 2,3-dioxygenase-like lactoylglutathione lyase family enzyme
LGAVSTRASAHRPGLGKRGSDPGVGLDANLSSWAVVLPANPLTACGAGKAPYAVAVTILRMDNVGIVFDDLDAAVAFFLELGLELEGTMTVEGEWSDRVVGLDGQRVDTAMMRTPDGHNKLELMSYQKPAMISPQPKNAPPNTLGLRRLMFAVDDIEDTIARLRTHGAELVGEVVRYEDIFLLCYLRGPEGVIVALAEELG